MGKMMQRLDYLDNAKAIAIVLVSFAHILGCFDSNTFSKSILIFCYGIELPIFFFISGILYRIKNYDEFNFNKKILRLLYPYFTFSIVYLLWDFIIITSRFVKNGEFSYNFFCNEFLSFVTGWGCGPLWFLSTFFLAELIFFYLRKKIIISLIISLLCIYIGDYCHQFYFSYLNYSASFFQYLLCYVARIGVAFSFMLIGYFLWPNLFFLISKVRSKIFVFLSSIFLIFAGGGAVYRIQKL
jgi:fucose 4-O-acetylase-like acetyltransferase